MEDDIVQIRFSFTIPDKKWLYDFSSKFSDLDFFILSLLPLSENTGNCLMQVKGVRYAVFLKEFKEFYEPNQFSILHISGNNLLFNVKMINPWFLQAIIKSDLILHYPIYIKRGKINIELIAERNNVDTLFTRFDEHQMKYSISYIGHYNTIPILTKKQEKILKFLLEGGYYEVPRRNTLSNFATLLKMSPSSLSEIIRRFSRNLANNYFKKQRKK